ncbi:TPA: aspartate 1-decarboxylase [Legionella pneumophila]|uniref:Aspartate 1-decarboxylase n=1 Tax=Legionella pneumophila (strain Lens) TaxID=297245 RepID=PAND_LEGPL|nr:aspartate 1-decarboxylase [Legionella pneumophila]Q5WSM2.1 RecName: Full=Aspartate 1-decarboxylase; AltName: Full=Aspartate alpha-decarboxylase; Contains: RecName: Full=Aspartate 1-decarboxylase beta chain; Contains: RecName: Full=Aspartate 1-decarboxylase alpha chain; Flags: Precursor [Legionella pneumophila str. Lens]ANH14267.1 aspartate 1-decarboxylase [Legionella pneumophila]ANH17226.1 aspartate 1-decarboxylase [Legionella pneumophila]ANH20203.1 aspartate 1-decarboxylase [Legionella pneu
MAYRKMLKSKIHRACVTQADLDYEGSITISPELLKAANILPYEAVNVWNITAGTRFETYAITGEKGSTDICVNGAAAHLVTPGDLVIIASFTQILEEDCAAHEPTVVFVDQFNRLKEIRPERIGVKNKIPCSA